MNDLLILSHEDFSVLPNLPLGESVNLVITGIVVRQETELSDVSAAGQHDFIPTTGVTELKIVSIIRIMTP